MVGTSYRNTNGVFQVYFLREDPLLSVPRVISKLPSLLCPRLAPLRCPLWRVWTGSSCSSQSLIGAWGSLGNRLGNAFFFFLLSSESEYLKSRAEVGQDACRRGRGRRPGPTGSVAPEVHSLSNSRGWEGSRAGYLSRRSHPVGVTFRVLSFLRLTEIAMF